MQLSEGSRPGRQRRLAYYGATLGILYAGVSAYWALGGTGLLDTIGGSLERTARAGGTAVSATLWAVVLLKLIAAGLPLGALSATPGSHRRRAVYRLAVLEAVILVGYGLTLTAVGLLVQAGVIHHSAHADSRALAWHAFLWDPWFLIWGLAVALALRPYPPGSSDGRDRSSRICRAARGVHRGGRARDESERARSSVPDGEHHLEIDGDPAR